MSVPDKQTFETLTQARTVQNNTTQFSLFPDTIPNTPNLTAEYWLYSDLNKLFGPTLFPTSPNMDTHVWKNLLMPETPKSKHSKTITLQNANYNFYSGHVATTHHPYSLYGGQTFKNAADLQLSRYACWCLTRKNPELIFARAYFLSPSIAPNASYDTIRQYATQFRRINLREQLKYYEKILSGIIQKLDAGHSMLRNEMTRTFYYGYHESDLKDIYKIPTKQNDPISNYMGVASLIARISALRNTIDRFGKSYYKNIDTLRGILYEELTNQRVKMIQNTSRAPEQDMTPTPVSRAQSKLSELEQTFIAQYANTKIR